MIQLAVNGAGGRMGKRICSLADDDARFTIAAALVRDDRQSIDAMHARNEHIKCNAVIDFSSDDGARFAADVALHARAALLVGTTALSPQTLEKMGDCARSIPVMHAPNTSRGVAVMNHLIARAARMLGDEFDIDLIDTHHAAKRDAPSGTALRFVETLREDAGITLDAQRVHSLREGDVIGDHEMIFAGPGERIKISHFATSRDVFALGALRTALWLAQQQPGMYRIEQSLELDS